MDTGALIMRVIHIVCGVYWAGTLLFVATFLQPSVAEAGPEGGKVMQALMRRRFLDVMPIVALLTVLTGIDLYRRVSAGFQTAWITSGTGLSITIGAVSAIIGLAIGVTVLRPTAGKVGALSAQAAGGDQAAAAEAQRLRGRMATAGRVVAALLLIAVIGMAAARYL